MAGCNPQGGNVIWYTVLKAQLLAIDTNIHESSSI